MKRAKPYILLADDDADDRYLMGLCFSELAWSEHVRIVESGEDVLACLNGSTEPHYPSLIVLDYNMLRHSGEEILRRLKGHHAYKKIPVVVYSTSMSPDLSNRLVTLGAVSCHAKPGRYERVLELARTFRELAEAKGVAAGGS